MAERRVLGMDLALNHGAIIELVNGEKNRFWYVTDNASSKKKGGRCATYFSHPKGMDRIHLAMTRLVKWRVILNGILLDTNPDYVAIEDYALGKSQGAHQIGELGGLARLLLWDLGITWRSYDPKTLKMFVAHDGNASKEEVEAAVLARWGEDFSAYNGDPGKRKSKKPLSKSALEKQRQTSGDLCDAYTAAKLVDLEARLRSGEASLADLHEKEVQVFNRCTKKEPVNLLGREWIKRPDNV